MLKLLFLAFPLHTAEDWTRELQLAHFPKEVEVIRVDDNHSSEPKVLPGYEGESTRQNQCEGSKNVLNWHQRVEFHYGPNTVSVPYSYVPTFTVPPLNGRVHTVEWRGDFIGEVWIRNGASVSLTGDPQADWEIISGLIGANDLAVRVDRIWRGANRVKFIDLAQPPAPIHGNEPH
jgi:hypothetical protein